LCRAGGGAAGAALLNAAVAARRDGCLADAAVAAADRRETLPEAEIRGAVPVRPGRG